MKKKILYSVGALLVYLVGFYTSSVFAEKEVSVRYPFENNLSDKLSYACSAQVGSFMSAGDVPTSPDKLIASVDKGTDQIAITINEDNTVTVLTAADVEGGTTEGLGYTVAVNDNEKLIAVRQEGISSQLTSIVINKKNGLGFYNSTHANFVFGQPINTSIMLSCI